LLGISNYSTSLLLIKTKIDNDPFGTIDFSEFRTLHELLSVYCLVNTQ